GAIYQGLKDYEKALEYQNKAVVIFEEILSDDNATLGIMYNNISDTYQNLKDFDKSIVYQRKCVKIIQKTLPKTHPYQQRFFNNLLTRYFYRGQNFYYNADFKSALTDFEFIHENVDSSYKDYHQVWKLTGLCYYQLGNYSEAIEAYSQEGKYTFDQKGKDYFSNLGLAYTKNNQFDEARVAFTKYEELYPDSAISYRNWAVYYGMQNNSEKALIFLRKAIDLGYKDNQWLEKEESLNFLRKEEEFLTIQNKLRKKVSGKINLFSILIIVFTLSLVLIIIIQKQKS
ncbi:MAG: tetratricopeptide repeat protein, partial [Bacteroidetes bacterium]|nr:tetratricopeptide repeat protein [Bacteroidota bacterium]